MVKCLELLITPPMGEQDVHITHTNELVHLGKVPYEGDLPVVNYGFSLEVLKDFPDIPSPRANTYLLNLKHLIVERGCMGNRLSLDTNYTDMWSKFALPRWLPLLPEENLERKKILQHLLPIGGAMVLQTSDEKIVIEERGGMLKHQGVIWLPPQVGVKLESGKYSPTFFRVSRTKLSRNWGCYLEKITMRKSNS